MSTHRRTRAALVAMVMAIPIAAVVAGCANEISGTPVAAPGEAGKGLAPADLLSTTCRQFLTMDDTTRREVITAMGAKRAILPLPLSLIKLVAGTAEALRLPFPVATDQHRQRHPDVSAGRQLDVIHQSRRAQYVKRHHGRLPWLESRSVRLIEQPG